jgi:Cys-tRNA(Pro)/Cys-tRNA(Cys) deacylase
MARTTPATVVLTRQGIAFDLVSYDYEPGPGRVALQAAESLGVAPDRVFKTLLALVDGRPVCAVLPADAELNLKKLAAAAGGKVARMMTVPEAERSTGYRVGGISPFGQRRAVPTLFDGSVLAQPHVYVNGGQRGLQVRLAPADAIAAAAATTADLNR